MWAAIVVPLVGLWLAEAMRVVVIERFANQEISHLVWTLGLTLAVAVFGLLMAALISRTQRRILSQNRDLGAIFASSPAVQAGSDVREILVLALQRLVSETGALAGIARVEGGEMPSLIARYPPELPAGLNWLASLLDERSTISSSAELHRHDAVDASILDIPLLGGGETLGIIRLAFHPTMDPQVSREALADIGSAVGSAIYVAHLLSDLRRRERERDALYRVAVSLTGRVDLADVLDEVTHQARTLLSADRAVACLADAGGQGRTTDRLALTDEGLTCVVAHRSLVGRHDQNPDCRLQLHAPAAFASRPLRGPDSILGELCVAREGPAFDERETNLLGALADLTAVAIRTARAWEAEEQMAILAERDRIAREMHDSLAQVLGVIHLRLRDIASSSDVSSEQVGEQLGDLADVADEAYRDVREAILGLRETVSSDKGLEGTLRDYLVKYSRQTGMSARLVWSLPDADVFTPRSEVQLLRVVQEALTNVRKHAQASSVVIRLEDDGHGPVLTVEDDGSGFDPGSLTESITGGFGLAAMRERVEQVGGQMEINSTVGAGTRIIVRLPPGDPRVASPSTLSPPAGR